MSDADKLLGKLPKRTPLWAVGLTTVLVAVTTCLLTFYVVAREDIKSELSWRAQSADAQSVRDDVKETKVIDAILLTIKDNTRKLSELDKQLVDAKIEGSTLGVRVADLERAVDRLKESLNSCQDSLRLCIEKKTVKP